MKIEELWLDHQEFYDLIYRIKDGHFDGSFEDLRLQSFTVSLFYRSSFLENQDSNRTWTMVHSDNMMVTCKNIKVELPWLKNK